MATETPMLLWPWPLLLKSTAQINAPVGEYLARNGSPFEDEVRLNVPGPGAKSAVPVKKPVT